jgi:hypothetical protein
VAAKEEELSSLHQAVCDNLKSLMRDEDPKVQVGAIQAAIRFLKDNSITSQSSKDVSLQGLHAELRELAPDREELERLMRISPDA